MFDNQPRNIVLQNNLFIKLNELQFSYSRSSKPGGQNVNKLNTRVTLSFDIKECSTLSDFQKEKILRENSSFITLSGKILFHSQEHRTQKQNRESAINRFREFMIEILTPQISRIPTKVSFSQKNKRLDSKKKHAEKKQMRKFKL